MGKRATLKGGLIWPLGAEARGPELFMEVEEGRATGPAGLAGTHLADMLCEAVPRARRPSTHRPKHSVTSGEFQSWSTGCGTRTPVPRAQLRPGTGNLGWGLGPRPREAEGEKNLHGDGGGRGGEGSPRVAVAGPGRAGKRSTGSTPGARRRRRAARGQRGEGRSPHPRSARRWGLSQHSQVPAQDAGLSRCPRGSARPPALESGSHSR